MKYVEKITVGQMKGGETYIEDVSSYQAFEFMTVKKERSTLTVSFLNFKEDSKNTDAIMLQKNKGKDIGELYNTYKEDFRVDTSIIFRKHAMKHNSKDEFKRDIIPEDVNLEEVYVNALSLYEKLLEGSKGVKPYYGKVTIYGEGGLTEENKLMEYEEKLI